MKGKPDRRLHDPARLEVLRRAALLDTAPEEAFDRLARLATKVVRAPIALVGLVDAEREFLKSCIGLAEPWATRRELPLTLAFCARVVASGEPLIVENAREHRLLRDHAGIGELGVVAYVGFPLRVSTGHVIGAFCVIDREPRVWTADQIEIVRDLTAAVLTEIEVRLDITARKEAAEALRESEERFRQLAEHVREGFWISPPNKDRFVYISPAYEEIWGMSSEELRERPGAFLTAIHPEDRDRVVASLPLQLRGGYDQEYRIVRPDGELRWIRDRAFPVRNSEGEVYRVVGIAEDITDRKRAEQELEQSLSLLRATLDSTADGILVVNRDGVVESFNQKFVEMWGIPPELAMAGRDEELVKVVQDQLKNPEAFQEKIRELYADPEAESHDTLEFEDGRTFERYSRPQRIGRAIVGRVWSFRDVSERKRAEEALRNLALVDELTGLYNRRGFLTLAARQLRLAARNKRKLLLLFADIDGLKRINDGFGHPEGDQVLVHAASLLRETFRESDIVGRIGGDEFAVLAVDADEDTKRVLVSRLQQNLDAFNAAGERPFALSMSVGVVFCSADRPTSIDDLLARADRLMYRRKRRR